MLHTVNKSPFERNALESCLAHVQAGSAVLLIEDGVYGALEGTSVTARVKETMKKNIPIYALQPDVTARGMQNRVIEGIKLVDYGGFVDLVTQQNGVQAWL